MSLINKDETLTVILFSKITIEDGRGKKKLFYKPLKEVKPFLFCSKCVLKHIKVFCYITKA